MSALFEVKNRFDLDIKSTLQCCNTISKAYENFLNAFKLILHKVPNFSVKL